MRTLDKNLAYSYLNKIKKENVNVSQYMKMVASSEAVPYDVMVFINRYVGLPQLATYNEIYDRRRKNPLYKNLVNENLSDEDKAIALSSLLTQTFIHTKQLVKEGKQEDVKIYSEIMNMTAITEALCEYSLHNNAEKMNEIFLGIRDVFKSLFWGSVWLG